MKTREYNQLFEARQHWELGHVQTMHRESGSHMKVLLKEKIEKERSHWRKGEGEGRGGGDTLKDADRLASQM